MHSHTHVNVGLGFLSDIPADVQTVVHVSKHLLGCIPEAKGLYLQHAGVEPTQVFFLFLGINSGFLENLEHQI